MRLVLAALPGMGNAVLRSLAAAPGVTPAGVFTVHHDRPFPYWDCPQLTETCAELEVPCEADADPATPAGLERLRAWAPHVLLTATWRSIIPGRVRECASRAAVNLHPSLLPRHRGPCPTAAALLAGDETTGVTAHLMTDEPDAGPILMQRSVAIEPDDDDGRLRRRLAALAADMAPQVARLYADPDHPPELTPQPRAAAGEAPRLRPEDVVLDRLDDAEQVLRTVRAATPLPGAVWRIGDRAVRIRAGRRLPAPPADPPVVTDEAVEVAVGGVGLRLLRASADDAGGG